MFNRLRIPFVVSCILLPAIAQAQVVTFGTGLNAASISAARNAFRMDLGGGAVAGPNGLFGGVRREINWDGVPDIRSAPNALPANFFNVNSPRGAVFSTPGTGFQVSANAGVATIQFDNIDPGYSRNFEPFSAQRLFTPIGSNILDVNFFLPGTTTPGNVRGFGSVFSDVDLDATTSIQYFDLNNNSLGTFFVPATPGSETFSFLGVSFTDPIIRRVRITNGNAALAAGVADGGQTDLVVMDDFLYSQPVPEPGSLALFTGMAITGGLVIIRRRTRTRRN